MTVTGNPPPKPPPKAPPVEKPNTATETTGEVAEGLNAAGGFIGATGQLMGTATQIAAHVSQDPYNNAQTSREQGLELFKVVKAADDQATAAMVRKSQENTTKLNQTIEKWRQRHKDADKDASGNLVPPSGIA